jgi:hypothetical protein
LIEGEAEIGKTRLLASAGATVAPPVPRPVPRWSGSPEWTASRENGSVDVLIERDSELAVLGGVVEGAVAGSGGAVLIEGEPGIGKTRLLGWARVRAPAAGARVLYATADEVEGGVPLAAARMLLARAASGLGRVGRRGLGCSRLREGWRSRAVPVRGRMRWCTRCGG